MAKKSHSHLVITYRNFAGSLIAHPVAELKWILMSKESETTLTPDHVGAGVAFKEQKI
jgi:hypothetical protein